MKPEYGTCRFCGAKFMWICDRKAHRSPFNPNPIPVQVCPEGTVGAVRVLLVATDGQSAKSVMALVPPHIDTTMTLKQAYIPHKLTCVKKEG